MVRHNFQESNPVGVILDYCFIKRTWLLAILIFLMSLFPLAGQEANPDSEPSESTESRDTEPEENQEIEWDTWVPDLYRTGDKIFNITGGIVIPAFFSGKGLAGNSSNIKLGGTGSVSYTYFFNPHWFLGGELQGMFAGTGGGNMVYIVPFGMYIGYQFVIGRFEFPVRLMTGAAPQKYAEMGYFGWIVKPAVSGFFRYDADWSFGLNAQWWILPQWPKNGKNVLGNFLEISLSARYHF